MSGISETFGSPGGGGELGSLDNNAAMLKDHGTTERTELGSVWERSGIVNDEANYILIAEDYGMGKSKKKYGMPPTATTTTTGATPATSNRFGGAVTTSGGTG